MSQFKKNQKASAMSMLVSQFGATVETISGSKSVVGSLESVSPEIAGAAVSDYETAENAIKSDLRSVLADERGVTVDQIEDHELADYENGIEAAAIVLMNHRNLEDYRTSAISAPSDAALNSISPINGSNGNSNVVGSVEGFDVNAIDTYKEHSIAYNLQAPRQDAFAEMFYPTYIGTADQAMFRASIDRVMIAPRVDHTLDGVAKSFNKRNVLEAYRDHKILDDNSTDLVPVIDDSNKSNFVDASVAANRPKVIDGHKFSTRPLKANTEIGLIGISSHPGLIAAGLMDQNESVDHNAGISELAVKVTNGTDTAYLSINVLKLPSAKFIKTPQGHGFDTNSHLRTEVVLSAATRTTDGDEVTMLKPFFDAKKTATIRLGADTDLNLERGRIEMSPRKVEITGALNDLGNSIDPADDAVLKDLSFEIVGFTVDARRTNSTRRSAGHRVDMDKWEEIYPVGLLAPIVAQDPTTPYAKESKLKAMVQATHVRINNAAVTALLNTAEHLEQVVDQNVGGFVTADSETGGNVEGIARMVMKPHFRRDVIDLEQVVANISSKDKLKDVQGHFIAYINEAGYRMVQNTGIRIASKALNGGIEKEIKLLIGTDEILPVFMMIQGDDRTTGIKLKYQIESSSDQRMFGKIVLGLGQEGTGFMPLNFGNFLWIPELVSEIPVNRSGGTVRETMVQPRFRHICNVPAMEVIDVVGLTKTVANKLAIKTTETP